MLWMMEMETSPTSIRCASSKHLHPGHHATHLTNFDLIFNDQASSAELRLDFDAPLETTTANVSLSEISLQSTPGFRPLTQHVSLSDGNATIIVDTHQCGVVHVFFSNQTLDAIRNQPSLARSQSSTFLSMPPGVGIDAFGNTQVPPFWHPQHGKCMC